MDFFRQLREARAEDIVVSEAGKDEAYFTIFRSSTDAIIIEALPAFNDHVNQLTLPKEVVQEAKERDFDLTKADVSRYFVAQATAEVLTSGLFYETVCPNFSLKPILKGTTPSTSAAMLQTFLENLDEAMRMAGDYETIFTLSEGARFVLGAESDSLRALWLALFDVLDGVKFADINSEIIGVIFERLISSERRQDMGQHYTQSRLARAMTRWAVRSEDDKVVGFCAGGGTFLVEAYNELRKSKSHEDVLTQVFGNDLDSFAVQLSTVNLATRDVYKGHNFPAVANRDALDIRPGELAVDVTPQNGSPYRLPFPAAFDVVLGNPPYDEKADTPVDYRKDLSKIAASGGTHVLPAGMPDNVNLAAWFILLAAAWLKPSGRIALVLPASILQNEKHVPLMRWVRANYDVAVWHSESDVWFSDARVAPIAMFMEPRPKGASGHGKFEFVNVIDPVDGDVDTSAGLPRPCGNHLMRDLSSLPPRSDALIAGAHPEALRDFEACPNLLRLQDITDVSIYRGNKLGHAFYRLKDLDPQSNGARRKLRGFDIQTAFNKKYLTPMLRSPMDEPTGEFDVNKVDWWVLSAPKTLPKGGELEKYIRAVRRAGAHDAPSVKAKGASWWSVDWKKAHIAVSVHPQFQPQVWWSDKAFVTTDNFQAISLPSSVPLTDQESVAASLASVFGSLAALYRSSEVGCEGVRWVSTQNVQEWFALNWSKVSASDKAAVLKAYRAFRKATYAKVFEMPSSAIALWRTLNVAVAKAAGAADPDALADAAFAEADNTTHRRRRREIQATAGRTRSGSTGSGKFRRDIKAFVEGHDNFLPTVEALTEGDEVVTLTPSEVPALLFEVDNEAEKARLGNHLVEILGDRFRAAPVFEDATVELVSELDKAVAKQFVQMDGNGDVLQG
ncbi:HsdM family class I SAM-dependent methyltransferase [Kocuria tytonis]|uniref:HsdM family class I SAM-dependent methyltransferase n=1 Tax=Kocuria tytonis TaxID=2054280 RepID=UPI0013142834|nr:N-6 DNA methylase [Kocuria tytonis]